MSVAWRFLDRREMSECRLFIEWDAYVVNLSVSLADPIQRGWVKPW